MLAMRPKGNSLPVCPVMQQSLKYAHRFILEIQHSAPSMPVLLVGNKLDLQSDTTLTMAAVQVKARVSVCG